MKLCVYCNQEKPESEFYKGYGRKCKECSKRLVKEYRDKNAEHYREYERNRSNRAERVQKNKERLLWLKEHDYEKYRKQKTEANNRWRNKNEAKRIAEGRLNDAIRFGKIIRPTICPKCGVEGLIEAHHFDYSKPLDVIWLCSDCHHKLHVEKRREMENVV